MGTVTVLSPGAIGDERFGGRGMSRTNNLLPFAGIEFRRGAYDAYFVLADSPKTFPFTGLTVLAKLVDTRIRLAR
jgi:hypothetical protein